MSKDGGPAFGATIRANPGEYACGPAGGLSVLDYFAGQALANPDITGEESDNVEVARACYAYADMMLEERGQRMKAATEDS